MIEHIIKSFVLAIGLGVDSFSISLINGMTYQGKNRKILIEQSLIFALCQGIMPFIGYIALVYFSSKLLIIKEIAPYISLILLAYLGIKLIIESRKNELVDNASNNLSFSIFLLQGIATSIDAISCSFSMISLSLNDALIEILIITIITYLMCYIAIHIGKEIGNRIEKYSKVIGGIVLILIGIIIFIRR